jgi:hypothetical protein
MKKVKKITISLKIKVLIHVKYYASTLMNISMDLIKTKLRT